MHNKKPDYKHVTIEDIRKVKRFENYTDAEAQRLLYTIQQYASLLASFHSKQQQQ